MSSSPTDGGRRGPAEPGASTAETRDVVEVTMPQMGVSVAEGTLVEWRKQVGDWVEVEETICEISTDKIDIEVPAPAAGRLEEILVDVEETVPVGTVLARLDRAASAGEPHPDEQLPRDASSPATATATETATEAAEAAEAEPAPAHPAAPPVDPRPAAPAGQPTAASANNPAAASANEPAAASANEPAAASVNEPSAASGKHYSPVVRRIAHSEGVDLSMVAGSGRGGRVRKQDVLAFIARRGNGRSAGEGREAAAAPRATGEPALHTESPYRELDGSTERLSRMRRSIAEHMVRSLRTAAHCTSIVEADFTAVQAARERTGMTYLPFVARCVIDALRAHPELNATLDGEELTRHAAVNLGIAISLGTDGLIVPVIHDAHELSHEGLARRISELAARARGGQLTPDDVRGGTFTITNPGGYGTLASTPIINQPQVAILDLEAVVKRPVVVTDDSRRDSISISPMAYLCLSWDHRALDGALAAQFLSTVRARIEAWGAA